MDVVSVRTVPGDTDRSEFAMVTTRNDAASWLQQCPVVVHVQVSRDWMPRGGART